MCSAYTIGFTILCLPVEQEFAGDLQFGVTELKGSRGYRERKKGLY